MRENQQGPIPVRPGQRAGPRRFPVQSKKVADGLRGKPEKEVPLRPPAPPRHYLDELPFEVDPTVVDEALEEVNKGNTLDLRADGCELTVRIAPAVRDAIQQSGITPAGMKRLFDRIPKDLGSQEAIAKRTPLEGTPGLRMYRTLVGMPGGSVQFWLLFTWLPESSSIVMVTCFTHRQRDH